MSFGSGFPSCASTDARRLRAAWASESPSLCRDSATLRSVTGRRLCARRACRGSGRYPIDPLVLEEALPELGQVVVPVDLEAAEQLFGAPPKHDVIVGPLADEGLVAVVLPAGGWPADQLVVVLAGSRQLAVGAAEHRVAEVVVSQRKGF